MLIFSIGEIFVMNRLISFHEVGDFVIFTGYWLLIAAWACTLIGVWRRHETVIVKAGFTGIIYLANLNGIYGFCIAFIIFVLVWREDIKNFFRWIFMRKSTLI